jgi:hypothetical protein
MHRGVRIRESVWELKSVVIRIAQAAIAEAEPHRRRFPNFCLRKGCRDYQPRGGP